MSLLKTLREKEKIIPIDPLPHRILDVSHFKSFHRGQLKCVRNDGISS